MVAPAWIATVSDWLPVIQLAGVILIFKYVRDTAAIRMATLQPLLVLDQQLRDTDDQILRQSHHATPATVLAENLLVRNIGTGPAYDVIYTFDGVERIFRSSIPYLKPGQAIQPAISKIFIDRGNVKFEATYSSVASVRMRSRQVLRDGVLGSFAVKRLGIFRQSFAFLGRMKQTMRTKLKDRHTHN